MIAAVERLCTQGSNRRSCIEEYRSGQWRLWVRESTLLNFRYKSALIFATVQVQPAGHNFTWCRKLFEPKNNDKDLAAYVIPRSPAYHPGIPK
jgi:hypothetical protein